MRAILLFVAVLLLALTIVTAQDQLSQIENALGSSCQLGDPSCDTVSDAQLTDSLWIQSAALDSATSSAPSVSSDSIWHQEPTIWTDATTSESEQYASPLSAAPEAAVETTPVESTTTQEQTTSSTSISYRFTLGYDTDTSTISTSSAFKLSANIPVLTAIFATLAFAFYTII
ncbi:hypothetical protein GGH14_003011 [Coemansia sp. RSA 370]|nr:hypothetical protein GGH14_003011 [Coemansia sp. RSA 370]